MSRRHLCLLLLSALLGIPSAQRKVVPVHGAMAPGTVKTIGGHVDQQSVILPAVLAPIVLAGARPKVDRVMRSLLPGAVKGIGGFAGGRIRAHRDNYLKRFDIDRYVDMVRRREHTEWGWIAEQNGKWMESAVLAAAEGGDEALGQKARAVFAAVIATQEPDGYVGVTPKAVRTADKPLRGMDPYELYFLLHALLTAHEHWGEAPALGAARKLGDYFVEHVGPGKAEFWPSPYRPPENVRTIVCEQYTWVPEGTPKAPTLHVFSQIAGHTAHYSWEGTLLIDPMLRLYQATGDGRYLDWSRWVIEGIDRWSGWDSFSRLDLVAAGELGVHQLQPYVHAHTF
ncbi:MAG: glycoside hydrolase family 127 protein, partial [Planctomycetota bacterium]|nr:glycoside hydrolase family 127 protein [Planctomycetota bacterium]